MPMSTDVMLPSHVEPIFPCMCIVCHGQPDSTTKILQNSQSWYAVVLFPLAYLFGWSRVEIPICRSCKWRFKLQRWSRELICWMLVVVALWFIAPYFRGWAPLPRKIIVISLILVAISPYLLGQLFWPRIFNTTAESKTVDYEFASLDYAIAFYALNRDTVIKSDLNEFALSLSGSRSSPDEDEDDGSA